MEPEFLKYIIKEFSMNIDIFRSLLSNTGEDEYLWKQNENKWCLLEIICHLYDEEREDFRTRFISVLKNPEHTFPSVDPPGWVKERKYLDQNFNSKLNDFIKERNKSIDWLKNLSTPDWGNTHQHPKIGPMSAKMIISNWLAHDYLHIRQIIRLKFDYLKYRTGERLQYASSW